MDQDYTQDLVNCQNCKCIKKHTSLLDCFHNVCQDCEQENENTTCQSCPQNPQIPREGLNHQLNALLYEHLTNQDLVDPDAKKCTMCGKLEDTVYCINCGTFWCEFGVEELHNAIIARGHKHILKKEANQFDFHLMPKGEGDNDDEAEWDIILGVFEKMEHEGREDQEHIMQERSSFEDWKKEQENEVGNLFDRIMEKVMEGKKKFIRELNTKCDNMQQKLEEKMNQNEMKLITLKRAYQLVTKMKFHKITSEPMKEFLIDRRIIPNLSTERMRGLIKHVDIEPLREVEELLNMNLIHDPPCLKNSYICLPDSGKVNEVMTINVFLKNDNNHSLKGDPGSISVEVTKNGKDPKPYPVIDHKAEFVPAQSGTYVVRLKIRDSLKRPGVSTIIKGRAMSTESITPVIGSIYEQGLHRAITAADDNHLYCVVKKPPEIRKYYVAIISPDSQEATREKSLSLDLETNFGQGQLGSPCGICYLDAHLYVVDAGFNCVHIFTNNGEYKDKFGRTGQELGQFQRPMGIDYDCFRKEILIADTFNNRIQSCRNTLETRVFLCFGTNEHFTLKDPVDVKACKNGNTVVTTLKAQILLYDIARNLSRVLFHEILTPRHCCIDSDDNIYVTSHLGHSVYKLVQTEGGMDAFERIKLKTHPEFRFPTGVAMNGDGKLYVISRELNPDSSQSFISIW